MGPTRRGVPPLPPLREGKREGRLGCLFYPRRSSWAEQSEARIETSPTQKDVGLDTRLRRYPGPRGEAGAGSTTC